MRKVKVAATQMSCSWNREEVLDKAEKLVRKAAAEGANIILLQELFETPYFCQKQKLQKSFRLFCQSVFMKRQEIQHLIQ